MDNLTIIQQALQHLGGWQKQAGNFHMVQCPFHDDRSPSCGVYMSYTPYRHFTLGSFNCLGCGAHGGWNEFATQTNLPTIKEFESVEHTTSNFLTRDQEYSMLGQDLGTMSSVLRAMDCMEAAPWPESFKWRGFDGKLLSRFGGMIASDKKEASVLLILPVKVNGKVRGAVRATYEKSENQRTSYITSPGDWVKTHGLLGFDQAKTIIRKYKRNYLVLVEGPRDALRLLKRGIPACAVLGSKNIARTKVNLCYALGIDTLYVMPDNDAAGTDMWERVKKHADGRPCRRLKLPREKDKTGKLIKMDPFSMPTDLLNTVFNLLEERHVL